MTSGETKRVSLRIQGKVQGVFFRESARREAERLGLSGWVRNVADGAVEAVAEGPTEQIEAFLAWCEHGPPTAHVTALKSSAEPPTGEHGGFRVERTR